MTTLEWVVLIWLGVLTLWALVLHVGQVRVARVLVKAGILTFTRYEESRKPCPPAYRPPDKPLPLDDPKNNPFLKAGIDAVKEHKQQQQKQKDSQDG